MDKSKLSKILLGSTVFFAIILLVYWVIYIRESVSSPDVFDNTEEVVETDTQEVGTQAEVNAEKKSGYDEEDEDELHQDNTEEDQSRNIEQTDSKEDAKVITRIEEEEDIKEEDATVQHFVGNSNSTTGFNNTYLDSLQIILNDGNVADLANFLNRLIKNVKYSSNNDVIVKSILSQQTLRQVLTNAEISYYDNGNISLINVNQLIDKARGLKSVDYLFFNKESLEIKHQVVLSIEISKMSTN